MTRWMWPLTWGITAIVAGSGLAAGLPWEAKDLNPVKVRPAPQHEPVVLVEGGQAKAVIAVMENAGNAADLRKFIAQATGIGLPMVTVPPSNGVAIVLGDCPEAEALGLVGEAMPPEGFAIRTAPNRVFVVGRNSGPDGNGAHWGVCEFLERFVGMRWYFPPAVTNGPEIGQDIPMTNRLVVPPTWIEDAPSFRIRDLWPPCAEPWQGRGIQLGPLHSFLRAGNSWPTRLQVHQPNWERSQELKNDRPEVFQLKRDGTRQYSVLCYGNPKTLETYLEGIQNFVEHKQPLYAPISAAKAITVSPADVELACYCDDCRRLWDDKGGQYGGASKVMATFVDRLAGEVQRRWPDQGFTIIFLPYLNYTAAPEGFKFPGNVEVQICGMPGMASYKEPAIRDAEQANIDRWIAISGRKIQNWHYCVWPAHKTRAAYQYPHVVKDFYQRNRDKTIGTFINGDFNHWPRQHISLYCWLKVLWNPDFDVDAALDEFCRRMFGPAAATMRELVGLQTDGWEKSRWPDGLFSPKGIYEASFPPATVAKMKDLLARARQEATGDALVSARLDYCAPDIEEFFKESDLMAGRGFNPLLAQKTGENPVLDGKLDEPAWARAPSVPFVQATGKDKGQPALYPTTVQGLYTTEGLTLGFRMTEPTPDLLETANGGHDNGNMWWDDNVEIFLDVTGKSSGEFYQFIVNPQGDYWDSKMKDTTWECPGFASKAARGKDFWCMEVFIPYKAFPEAKVPGSGTHTVWTGNCTRHRVADSRKEARLPESKREYQRMNTTGSTTSDNLADFAEIRFVE